MASVCEMALGPLGWLVDDMERCMWGFEALTEHEWSYFIETVSHEYIHMQFVAVLSHDY